MCILGPSSPDFRQIKILLIVIISFWWECKISFLSFPLYPERPIDRSRLLSMKTHRWSRINTYVDLHVRSYLLLFCRERQPSCIVIFQDQWYSGNNGVCIPQVEYTADNRQLKHVHRSDHILICWQIWCCFFK